MQHNNGLSKKPFPPYGSILNQIQILKIPIKSSLYCYCGKDALSDAMLTFEKGIICLALPYMAHPSSYIWPVRNIRLILFDTGGLIKDEFISYGDYFLDQGASDIILFSEEHSLLII